jgi:hypothetical protein
MNAEVFQAVVAVLTAGAGALARMLNQTNKENLPLFRTISSGFVAMFIGLLIHFAAASFTIDRNLSYAVAGLCGWMGPQSLEGIAAIISKKIGFNLETKPDELLKERL